ncbi:alkaline shock response membrane anchor protein AmaP [Streptomyces sp. A0592]|uniref:alkaline shock response membrane anchor protein AmaP n=1 Tax=Streptomyces sp. A0592 TaxID=2563099 RepID=UPI00109E6B76|nr:alkaline shock response membrane anchor protein AmaP [Streptomyces sp. A0592]THA75448.1 alkaline shock response membrane anchor protein AmaP [Streptomyces sp. A0592]
MKRKSVVNRALLTLTGAVLLGIGLLALAGSFDLYRRMPLTPPAGWPLAAPDEVLLDDSDRTHWTNEGWWWPTVIAALAIITLLALWWLLAQLRRSHPGDLSLEEAPALDGVELHEGALSDAIAADAGHLPGIQRARARMEGSSRHPETHLDITLTPDAEPGPVLRALSDGPLQRVRRSTGRTLSATARLRVPPHKSHRAQ